MSNISYAKPLVGSSPWVTAYYVKLKKVDPSTYSKYIVDRAVVKVFGLEKTGILPVAKILPALFRFKRNSDKLAIFQT